MIWIVMCYVEQNHDQIGLRCSGLLGFRYKQVSL